jgi:hypothetical protein
VSDRYQTGQTAKPIPDRANGKTDTKTEQLEYEYNKNTSFNTAIFKNIYDALHFSTFVGMRHRVRPAVEHF